MKRNNSLKKKFLKFKENQFEKKMSKLVVKNQDIEMILMQSYSEREKQSKLIEDLTNKYIIMENEKNEMENLVISVKL